MSNNTTVSGSASSVVVEGLAELTKEEKIAKIRKLEAEKAGRATAEKKIAARKARLSDLANGTNEAGKNPKLRHNPQLRPDTLRQAEEGELINGTPAKGWVVSIECEVCGEVREVNTQDAFQVRFCETHKAEAQKAASKARRAAKRDAELAKLSDDDLDAQIAELTAAAA
jgi:hypothetical protein